MHLTTNVYLPDRLSGLLPQLEVLLDEKIESERKLYISAAVTEHQSRVNGEAYIRSSRRRLDQLLHLKDELALTYHQIDEMHEYDIELEATGEEIVAIPAREVMGERMSNPTETEFHLF